MKVQVDQQYFQEACSQIESKESATNILFNIPHNVFILDTEVCFR